MSSRSIVLLPFALLALARPVGADAVSRMSTTFHAGQAFLVWTSPPGTGWTYRVYRASWPLIRARRSPIHSRRPDAERVA